MNWKMGCPTLSGTYWVKGVLGADPARVFRATARHAQRGVELVVSEFDRVLNAKDLRQGHYAPVMA